MNSLEWSYTRMHLPPFRTNKHISLTLNIASATLSRPEKMEKKVNMGLDVRREPK